MPPEHIRHLNSYAWTVGKDDTAYFRHNLQYIGSAVTKAINTSYPFQLTPFENAVNQTAAFRSKFSLNNSMNSQHHDTIPHIIVIYFIHVHTLLVCVCVFVRYSTHKRNGPVILPMTTITNYISV